jgi:hypothetical protein
MRIRQLPGVCTDINTALATALYPINRKSKYNLISYQLRQKRNETIQVYIEHGRIYSHT